jgi:hypothetical protein
MVLPWHTTKTLPLLSTVIAPAALGPGSPEASTNGGHVSHCIHQVNSRRLISTDVDGVAIRQLRQRDGKGQANCQFLGGAQKLKGTSFFCRAAIYSRCAGRGDSLSVRAHLGRMLPGGEVGAKRQIGRDVLSLESRRAFQNAAGRLKARASARPFGKSAGEQEVPPYGQRSR